MALSIAADNVILKRVQAVTVAGVLGGGTLIVQGSNTNAVQDEKLIQQQAITGALIVKLDVIANEMNQTNQKLERVVGRLEATPNGR